MRVAIFGAGSTGCYIGGLFALAGLDTTFICRERIKSSIEDAGGVRLTDYEGQDVRVMPNQLITEITSETFDIVFVTLKCHQLVSALEDLKTLSDRNCKLVFMQNGLGSLDAIADKLNPSLCLQGITPYNVLSKENATFHRGTEGKLIFQQSKETEHIKIALGKIDVACDLYSDMRPVIYGKLMLNLNNAINALADQPIKSELENRSLRKVLAGAMKEWLRVCEAENVEMVQYTAVKPKLVPTILSLPNWLFKILAAKMLAIDPEARSSMWEDIQAGRKTEVEFLNGAVARLGEKSGVSVPINQGIERLILQKESGDAISLAELSALA